MIQKIYIFYFELNYYLIWLFSFLFIPISNVISKQYNLNRFKIGVVLRKQTRFNSSIRLVNRLIDRDAIGWGTSLAPESPSSSDEPREEWTGGRQSQSQSIPFYRSLALVGFAFASISPRAPNSIDRGKFAPFTRSSYHCFWCHVSIRKVSGLRNP